MSYLGYNNYHNRSNAYPEAKIYLVDDDDDDAEFGEEKRKEGKVDRGAEQDKMRRRKRRVEDGRYDNPHFFNTD